MSMGFTGSLQKMDSWKSCSRRWRKTETEAGGAEAPACTVGVLLLQPHWCSTGGRTCARGGRAGPGREAWVIG